MGKRKQRRKNERRLLALLRDQRKLALLESISTQLGRLNDNVGLVAAVLSKLAEPAARSQGDAEGD